MKALWGIIAGSGVSILLWTWSVSRRRIEVTEQTVTVVSTFRRHEVPWSALSDIELDLLPDNDKYSVIGRDRPHVLMPRRQGPWPK